MTDQAVKNQIDEQIAALKKTTEQATRSKEAANKYLHDAGIKSDKKEIKFGDGYCSIGKGSKEKHYCQKCSPSDVKKVALWIAFGITLLILMLFLLSSLPS